MNDFDPLDLNQRREQILRLALDAAHAHNAGNGSPAQGPGVVAVLAIIFLARSIRPAADSPRVILTAAPKSPGVAFALLETDPNIVNQLALRPAPPLWRTIDDDQLLKALADAGQPSGLAYVDGHALLLPRTADH